jgi:hypothetical protein
MIGFTRERFGAASKSLTLKMMTAKAHIDERRKALLDARFMAWDNHDSNMRQRVLRKVRQF